MSQGLFYGFLCKSLNFVAIAVCFSIWFQEILAAKEEDLLATQKTLEEEHSEASGAEKIWTEVPPFDISNIFDELQFSRLLPA
eukprot:5653799-Amphidinium_carterae.1